MINTKKIVIVKTPTEIVINIQSPVKIILPLSLGGNFLVVLLRFIINPDGRPLLSYSDISELFSKSYRQWSNNIYKEWELSGKNLKLFLEDKRETSKEILSLVSEFVLSYPLRSLCEQHREFVLFYPAHSGLCINSFIDYVSAINCSKLITVIRKQLDDGKLNYKSSYFVKVLLSEGKKINPLLRSYISDLSTTGENLLPAIIGKDYDWDDKNIQKYLLVTMLYIYGISQDKLSLLFGVSKTSIHNWIHKILSKDIIFIILKMVAKWSGEICIDEKWIKVKGVWHFVLSAVDNKSGMPLFCKRFEKCNEATWTLFLKEFKMYYGVPKLIISDGSASIKAGLKIVFSGVRHQLCWFHKLRNLHKRIYGIEDSKIKTRAFKLAKGIFTNKCSSSRKKAARTLASIGSDVIAKYIDASFFSKWLNLNRCLTSNAVERYNRKIEKCIKCRYGIKNGKCADALINGLWFFEILTKGSMHCENNNEFQNINFSKILKGNFENKSIIHILQKNNNKTLKKVA